MKQYLSRSKTQILFYFLASAALSTAACSSSDSSGGGGGGGTAGSGGTAGAGGTGAGGTALSGPTDKLDILFMVDNSPGMAQKQELLTLTIPDFVNRLVDPYCVDAQGQKQNKQNGECPTGSSLEFAPVKDIHVGVVTSSLGGHGADICTDEIKNDKGQLITRGKDPSNPSSPVTPTGFYDNSSFFAWDASNPPRYPGKNALSDAGELTKQFNYVVAGAGESGCGYEAQLEAWYRFLVDPVPPVDVPALPNESKYQSAVPQGVNDALLIERAAFLRADSAVAIVVISDENDCSLADGPIPENGGFPNQVFQRQGSSSQDPFLFRPGNAACAANPYGADCTSCFLVNDSQKNDPIAQGCFDDQGNAKTMSRGTSSTRGEDPPNLRCWNQKQRYGIDGLYPLDRYVNGLTEPVIPGRKIDANGDTLTDEFGNPTAAQVNYFNPLLVKDWQAANDEARKLAEKNLDQGDYVAEFKKLEDKYVHNGAVRDNRLVFFTTVVGVPWQDLARDPTDLSQGIRLPIEFAEKVPGKAFSTWDLVLGDPFSTRKTANGAPEPPTPPLDPLMIERRDPIQNHPHPITGETLGGSDTWNSINGQDWNAVTDLQYACIMPLREQVDCAANGATCRDCGSPLDVEAQLGNPLCNTSGGPNASYANTQRRAKAYPGTRFLQVVKDFETKVQGNAIAASICSPNVTDNSRDDFAYRPALSTLLNRVKSQLVKQ